MIQGRAKLRIALGIYLGVWTLAVFGIVPLAGWIDMGEGAVVWGLLAAFWVGLLVLAFMERRLLRR